MCAYNVRRNKTLDHDPAAGPARKANRVREAAAWAIGLLTMAVVYWLARRYLF